MKKLKAGKDVFKLLHEDPTLLREEEKEEEKEDIHEAMVMTDNFQNEVAIQAVEDDSDDDSDDSPMSNLSTKTTESSMKQQYFMPPGRIMVVIHATSPPSELSSEMTISSSPIRLSRSHNRNLHHQHSRDTETKTEMENSTVLTESSIDSMSMDTVFNAARILVRLSASPPFEHQIEKIQK